MKLNFAAVTDVQQCGLNIRIVRLHISSSRLLFVLEKNSHVTASIKYLCGVSPQRACYQTVFSPNSLLINLFTWIQLVSLLIIVLCRNRNTFQRHLFDLIFSRLSNWSHSFALQLHLEPYGQRDRLSTHQCWTHTHTALCAGVVSINFSVGRFWFHLFFSTPDWNVFAPELQPLHVFLCFRQLKIIKWFSLFLWSLTEMFWTKKEKTKKQVFCLLYLLGFVVRRRKKRSLFANFNTFSWYCTTLSLFCFPNTLCNFILTGKMIEESSVFESNREFEWFKLWMIFLSSQTFL